MDDKVHYVFSGELYRGLCGRLLANPVPVRVAVPMDRVCRDCCTVALRVRR